MIERDRGLLVEERPDSEILGELFSILITDRRLNPHGIELDVSGGVVNLSGLVSSEAHRDLIEKHAYRTPGVRAVSNSILTMEP